MNKLSFILLYISFSLCLYSIELIPDFLQKTDSTDLKEIFTVNIGIMNLNETGKINLINPIDKQNVTNTIKNILDTVPRISLSKKASLYKALYYFKSKSADKDKKLLEKFEKDIFFQKDNIEQSLINKLVYEIKKNKTFYPSIQSWYENYENPSYLLRVGKPFETVYDTEKNICLAGKANDKAPQGLDLLFYGNIEKVDKFYAITISCYSYLLDKDLGSFTIVSDSENITNKLNEKFINFLPGIFSINYGSITIKTDDPDTSIYLDSSYAGKNNEMINYIPPSNYIVVLKKENYENKLININIKDFDNYILNSNVEIIKDLQQIYFNIEPNGTKIFINSQYQGKSPFKKALPAGNYVISAKNSLYESFRYILDIKEINKEEELNIVFHLKSIDTANFFKIKKTLYYAAFWNFTFSLIAMVPIDIFAYDYFYKNNSYVPGLTKFLEEENREMTTYEYNKGVEIYYTQQILYYFAFGISTYTILSIGWLFYTLADYIKAIEKRDFIPILEFYKDKKGEDEIKIGMNFKIKTR